MDKDNLQVSTKAFLLFVAIYLFYVQWNSNENKVSSIPDSIFICFGGPSFDYHCKQCICMETKWPTLNYTNKS